MGRKRFYESENTSAEEPDERINSGKTQVKEFITEG